MCRPGPIIIHKLTFHPLLTYHVALSLSFMSSFNYLENKNTNWNFLVKKKKSLAFGEGSVYMTLHTIIHDDHDFNVHTLKKKRVPKKVNINFFFSTYQFSSLHRSKGMKSLKKIIPSPSAYIKYKVGQKEGSNSKRRFSAAFSSCFHQCHPKIRISDFFFFG